MRLEVNHVTYSYGERPAADDVSLQVDSGEFVGLIGPNGGGKSTVLKMVYRGLTPERGSITLDGGDLLTMPYRTSAQKLAVVGQENEVPFDFSVEEIVAMGRSPHKRLLDGDTPHDRYMVRHALEHLGMEQLAKRSYRRLSGGEKQRVLIARAIAQESDFFILDEPTNHLDIRYQLQIFDFIKRLRVTVLAAIHDLNMAALYCDRLYVLKEGRVVLQGTPEEVLTPAHLEEVYGVRSTVETHPITGKRVITFLPAALSGGDMTFDPGTLNSKEVSS